MKMKETETLAKKYIYINRTQTGTKTKPSENMRGNQKN